MNDRSTSLSPEGESRYGRWPYYIPPYGWAADPTLGYGDPTVNWTSIFPRDRSTYFALVEQMRNYIEENELPDEDDLEILEFTPLTDNSALHASGRRMSPSPLFASVPRTERRDPRYTVYRMAQRQWPADPKKPAVHPAFVYDQSNPVPDLTWDLAHPVNFRDIAHSALVPLYPEEYLTPVTHPPVAHMHICFHIIPGLSFSILPTGKGGVVLGNLIEDMVSAMSTNLSVQEWNEMREEERRFFIRGYERRTGLKSPYISMQLLPDEKDEDTEFLLGDVLEDKVMFQGLEADPENTEIWYLHTTTRANCHSFSTQLRSSDS